MSDKHSDAFNNLPFEVRKIASKIVLKTEIRNLVFEKERLRKRYDQSLNEINKKIKYCKRDLDKD